ncbi:hypothetical protein [Sphingobacterium thermophilum]|uniref:SatD family (SatD) n=1 Tax=Sphingobacterium thermophilum TaxID=768534 RepID=A0ABP8R4G9_9SPHI
MSSLKAILTGDIVHSRKVSSEIWLSVLTDCLRHYSNKFDIFRGDSFQIELPLEKCIEAVFYIKASIRTIEKLDVRLGLGIGKIEVERQHVKDSSGEAYIFSGEAFDTLDKELIRVRSPFDHWDESTNIMLQLATELANRWTVNMAKTVKTAIEHPEASQLELTKLLHRKHQSQISTELKKANWQKIKLTIEYCTKQLLITC